MLIFINPARDPKQCGGSVGSRNAHQHVTRATLYGNLQEKCQMEHPDQAPAFTATVRTPQSGQTGWGGKIQYGISGSDTC